MTKTADPNTFSGAVRAIVGAVGVGACAEATKKSERTVYGWGDPDGETLPSVAQALDLDSLYVEAGHGRAPVLAVYRRAIAAVQGKPRTVGSAVDEMLDVAGAYGALADGLRTALGDGRITETERHDLLTRVGRLRAELEDVERALGARGLRPISEAVK